MLHCKLTCNVGKSFLLQLFLLLLFISCESETECVYKDSISVKFMPDKTEYFIGEKISYETNKILKAGPVWDFDWASLSKPKSASLKNTLYFDALFKSPAFINKGKEIWNTYSGKICIDEQIETLRAQIYKEQINDEKRWGRHADPSGIPRENFDAYVDFLKETLNEKFEIVKNEIESLE